MNDIVKQVGTWIVIMLLGYTTASMQDRYTASTAAADRVAMVQLIKESEERAIQRLLEHRTGGPHDDIAIRMTAIEIKIEALIEAIRNNEK